MIRRLLGGIAAVAGFAVLGVAAGTAASAQEDSEELLRGNVRNEQDDDGEVTRVPVEGVELTVVGPTAPRSPPPRPTPTAGSRSRCPDRATTRCALDNGDAARRTSTCATRPRRRSSVNVRPSERQVLNYFLGESQRQIQSRWDLLPQTIANGIKFGLIIAITAVGLSLIYGTTGLSNFTHGELVTLGAIVTWWMNQSVGLHVLLAAIPFGIAAGALGGFVSEAGLWQPLRRKGVGADVDDDRVDRRRPRRPLPLPVHVRRPLACLPRVRRAVGGRHRPDRR